MSGASGKPVVQKLGIKPGFRIFVDGIRTNYAGIVGELPAGVTITAHPAAPLDMAHLFATEAAGLAERLFSCRAAIVPAGVIWVSWPKRASGVPTDLGDVAVRSIALAQGLFDVKVCAIDEVWSGLKFVIPKAERA